ncbi:MAG: hypothetical protein QM784_22045 [Polyangiaceae bacterium]
MPGPGSYRLLDGKPYCPACVPFYAAWRQKTEGEVHAPVVDGVLATFASRSDATSRSDAMSRSRELGALTRGREPGELGTEARGREPGARECDCCGRALMREPAPREGYLLCEACEGSDAELALSVAKLRHRHRLAALGSKLGIEKDK